MEVTQSKRQPSPRVLVADDEPVTAETLAVILRRSGFEVVVVHDGHTAVRQAEMWKPHALVSDVVMPVMNGIDAAIQISSSLPGCRIVLISGTFATTDLQRDAGERGHWFEVLPKPIHPRELLERLQGLKAA
ncbi:MAG TPA: response regulator [Acidobacteriaceae bacterium]|nr:response regulator [Acidobacteriaceae bacterium]